MPDIKVEKAFWDTLPRKSRAHIARHLRTAGLLGERDSIVPADDARGPTADFKPFTDCGAYCNAEAEGVFRACMSSPEGSPELCQEVAQRAFFTCLEYCTEEGDDDDDDDDDD